MSIKKYFQIIFILIISLMFNICYAANSRDWEKVEAVIKINVLSKNEIRTHHSLLKELLQHSRKKINDVVEDDEVTVKTLQITYPVKERAKNITQNSLLKLSGPILLKAIDKTILEGADRIFIKYNKQNPEEIVFVIDEKDFIAPPMLISFDQLPIK